MLNKGSVFTKGKFMRKLTKEEKQKILFAMNVFFQNIHLLNPQNLSILLNLIF
jgi:ABC-type transporter Mla maintaining outer membrane lipid asymmetry ATPase subunit MlaF